MMGDMSVDPDCCCPTQCLIVDGVPDESVACSGDWDVDSFTASTLDDDALMYAPQWIPAGIQWQVQSKFTIEWGLSGGLGAESHHRLVGYMVDCDNYLFLELMNQALGTDATTMEMVLRLGICEAGVDTILAEQPYDRSHPDGCFGALAGGLIESFMELCWDGEHLYGAQKLGELLPWVVIGVSTAGLELNSEPIGFFQSHGGFGTKTLTNISTFLVSLFRIIRANNPIDGDAYCEFCRRSCCLHDATGTTLYDYLVEVDGTITGDIDMADSPQPIEDCTVPCDVVLGTHTVTRLDTEDEAACVGDASCEWGVRVDLDDVVCNDITYEAWLQVGFGVTQDSGDADDPRVISVAITLFLKEGVNIHTCGPLFTATAEVEGDCAEWTNWLDLDPVAGAGACVGCDVSGLTVRVKLAV